MDQHTGIRMCKYKEVRRDYGTIHYEQTQVEVPELKINYNELFEMKKLEGIPEFEQEGEIKKIEVKHKTKEEKIKQIAEETKEKTEKEMDQELEDLKEQEKKEELRELEEEQGQNEEEKEEQEEQEEQAEQAEQETSEQLEPEPSESSEQKGGGFLRKKIYVTNLSVEKDKEMFQM